MSTDSRSQKHWITHRYFRTYEVAARLSAIAHNPAAYLTELEDLTVDDGIITFIQNWQKETLVHQFSKWLADVMFFKDTNGPYVTSYSRDDAGYTKVERYLPVDLALQAYGLSTDAFSVPPPDGEYVQVKPNTYQWKESTKVADACYEYFVESLQLSQQYADLLDQIAEEVFHIVFLNRAVLAGLNKFLASHIQELGCNSLHGDREVDPLFTKQGKLKRAPIPKWVKRAVFFRDHGRCASCGCDLSGLIDILPAEQFDHMVPLAQGGLNDVSNLQLLCQRCNARKSDMTASVSNQYRRWFELPRKAGNTPS